MSGGEMAQIPLPLSTSSWRQYRPHMGIPVRITVGRPRRFAYGFETIDELAPRGIFHNPRFEGAAESVKRAAYLQLLDEQRPQILAALHRLAVGCDSRGAVLLCFEDVWAGQSCHRRWAADWFADRLGVDVPEARS
jgi:Protein of unknown function, DUF488